MVLRGILRRVVEYKAEPLPNGIFPALVADKRCTDVGQYGKTDKVAELFSAEPPKDYHCILNESLWFNRHMFYPYRNKRGRASSKSVEDRLVRCGFTRISDLLSSTESDSSRLMFMSIDEAQEKTGSKILAEALHKIIYDIMPFGWKMIVHRKRREPFRLGEWFVEQVAAASEGNPSIVYQVRIVSQSLLLGQAYRFHDAHPNVLQRILPISVKLLPTSHVIKACVMRDRDGQLVYCGNYLTCQLLLSRLSWTVSTSQTFGFFDFAVNLIYKTILEKKCKKVPALDRWHRILSFPIDNSWKAMIKYIQDPIINNRCKEVLYKIYTQVLPVGTTIEKFGKPKECCFCDEVETEFHLFLHCPRIARLWTWLHDFLLRHYSDVFVNNLTDWEKLVGFNSRIPNSSIQVWKIFHAETIRCIWASRCSMVFDHDDAPLQFEAMRAQIVARVEYAMTIRANVLQSSTCRRSSKILRAILQTWTVTIPISTFQKSVRGFWHLQNYHLMLPRVNSDGARPFS